MTSPLLVLSIKRSLSLVRLYVWPISIEPLATRGAGPMLSFASEIPPAAARTDATTEISAKRPGVSENGIKCDTYVTILHARRPRLGRVMLIRASEGSRGPGASD